MKLDPNLEKIRDDHLLEICQNKLGNTIGEAEDYLTYILGYDNSQIKKELAHFARHVRHIYLEHKHGKKD